MDDTSISFVELVALTRIGPDSTAERFGSTINSSFFDASNILATLKQKNLVDFVTAFPAQSTLKVTETGSKILAEATQKAAEAIDALDIAIMVQLASGKRGLVDLNGSVNVTKKDLAMHLFKLNAQQQISYELANANMSIYLTEKGFLTVKNSGQSIPAPQPVAPQQNGAGQQGMGLQSARDNNAAATQQQQIGDDSKVIEELVKRSKARKKRKLMIIGVVIILFLLVLVLYLKHY